MLRLAVVVFLSLFAIHGLASPVKVESSLQRTLREKGTVDIFITLESTKKLLTNFKSAAFTTRTDRKVAVANLLKSFANSSQKSLLAFLNEDAPGLAVKRFWITNQVYIKKADAALIERLAERSDVIHIQEELKNKIQLPEVVAKDVFRPQQEDLEWGLQKINVRSAWDAGFNGTGARVGIMDSGVRATHVALRDNFVGEYGWFSPTSFSELPEDSDGHGTHVTGTIVGLGGIGVAPGAKFMSCQNIPGDQAEDLACAQFFACPHLPDGSNPDCAKAADVVSNSWGYGGGNSFFDGALDAWEAAGIIPVFAAGNEGPTCTSLRSPGDSSHRALITVGSTDVNDNLSSFSSFGPSRFGGTKPDVSGPGSDVRSSYSTSDTAYTTMSGTSMATPHVAGVVALILSADQNTSIADIQRKIYQTATRTVATTGRNCGGVSETTFPNNHVGWGRLTASAALHNK